jgi:hypothetical protein
MIWLKSTGTGFLAFPLFINATQNYWNSIGGIQGGLGPRMNQIGDFNGDGLPDVVSFRTDNAIFGGGTTARLLVQLQKPRAPNVVKAIDGGPHAPKVDFNFERGSISSASPAVYTRGQCVWPQICLKDMGWVVSSHQVEAANFESAVPTRNVFKHSYADARVDARGRGFLGVATYSRRQFTDDLPTPVALREDTLEFDLNSTTCTVMGSQCTYTMLDSPIRQLHLVLLGGARTHVTEVVTRRDLFATGKRYRPLQVTTALAAA